MRAGLSDKAASTAMEHIEAKSFALKAAGVDDSTIQMIRNVLSSSWLALEGGGSIVTRRGGRPGCQHGPVLFNMGYSLPHAAGARKAS